MPPRSPLAPAETPALPPVAGVRLAARACGVRYQGRTDVCLMAFDPGTAVAGVFTRSLTASAPVDTSMVLAGPGTGAIAFSRSARLT